MDKYLETMRQMILLMDISLEALNYLADVAETKTADLPLYLLEDFAEAFKEMKQSYSVIEKKIAENQIKYYEDRLTNELSMVSGVNVFHDSASVLDYLINVLIPDAIAYRREMALLVNPHILC